MTNKKIYGLMVLSAIFWAGAFIAGKVSTQFIPPFTLTFLRFFFATSILYFIFKRKDSSSGKLTRRDIPVFLFTGIVGMFGYHVLFFASLKYTSAINSSIIGAANPIITTLLAIIFLKDKLSAARVLGILLSFAGVFLTITEGDISVVKGLSFNHGDILMIFAVLMWASYSVFSKKVSHRYTPLQLTFYSFLVCTIFLIPFVIYEAPWTWLNKVPYYAYASVLYMSIFPSVIGYLVQQISIKQIGPSRTSIFINLVPVFSIILSVAILGESISLIKIITALLIIIGVYICQRS